MIRLFSRWAVPCCVASACLWSVGCEPAAPPAAPPATEAHSHDEDHAHDAPAGESAPAAETPAADGAAPAAETPVTPPAGDAAAPSGGGSTINFGDL